MRTSSGALVGACGRDRIVGVRDGAEWWAAHDQQRARHRAPPRPAPRPRRARRPRRRPATGSTTSTSRTLTFEPTQATSGSTVGVAAQLPRQPRLLGRLASFSWARARSPTIVPLCELASSDGSPSREPLPPDPCSTSRRARARVPMRSRIEHLHRQRTITVISTVTTTTSTSTTVPPTSSSTSTTPTTVPTGVLVLRWVAALGRGDLVVLVGLLAASLSPPLVRQVRAHRRRRWFERHDSFRITSGDVNVGDPRSGTRPIPAAPRIPDDENDDAAIWTDAPRRRGDLTCGRKEVLDSPDS